MARKSGETGSGSSRGQPVALGPHAESQTQRAAIAAVLADTDWGRRARERFLSKIRRPLGDGCWVWQGARKAAGYGTFAVRLPTGVVVIGAHRLALALSVGVAQPEQTANHKCNNAPCCRVGAGHLGWGTQRENIREAALVGGWKGRPRGGKLTAVDVVEIRRLYQSGACLQRELAERFGVSQPTIVYALRGTNWGHVPGALEPEPERQGPRPTKDLRIKIAQAYAQGEGPRAVIARRFGVSESAVQRAVTFAAKQGAIPSTPTMVRHARRQRQLDLDLVAQQEQAMRRQLEGRDGLGRTREEIGRLTVQALQSARTAVLSGQDLHSALRDSMSEHNAYTSTARALSRGRASLANEPAGAAEVKRRAVEEIDRAIESCGAKRPRKGGWSVTAFATPTNTRGDK